MLAVVQEMRQEPDSVAHARMQLKLGAGEQTAVL